MKTLLQKLQSALSRVNGNTTTMQDEKNYDEYFCICCKNRVYEYQYNHLHRVCYKCWYERI